MQTAKVDLHLHLDGSLPLPWAFERALQKGILPPNTTREAFCDKMRFGSGKSAQEVMEMFDLPIALMQTREELHDTIYLLIERLAKSGLIYAEIRAASQHHTKGGLSQTQVLEALCDGRRDALRDFPSIRIGIINCLMHKLPDASANYQENLESIEATRAMLGNGVVALDLAGFENSGPFTDYAPFFEKARACNIPYTIHAGEMGEGVHVREAIAMGAHRIGHGINCVQDPAWLQEVVDTQIPLEVCVTSNLFLNLTYETHPIRTLLAAGANVTINTDNMTFSETDLANEHRQLRAIGVTEEQLTQCTRNAIRAAFLPEDEKQELLRATI